MVINIPATIHELPLDASNKKMPSGCIEINNSFGFKGYGGPQPPDGTGTHPYIFSVYALNIENLQVPGTFLTEAQLEKTIEQFKIGHAEFTLTYGN
jgi:Raf kinase inhibitor-like YbhB/YbcL family protein